MHHNCAHCELKFEREQGYFGGLAEQARAARRTKPVAHQIAAFSGIFIVLYFTAYLQRWSRHTDRRSISAAPVLL